MMKRSMYVLAASLLTACATQQRQQVTAAPPSDPISEANVRRVLAMLSADSMEGRFTGSRGAAQSRRFPGERDAGNRTEACR